MATTNDVIEVLRVLRGFIGPQQLSCLGDLCRGEEGAFFKQKMVDLAGVISRMPHTYQTDGQGKDAVVHLHYFKGGCDWWITEKDKGAPDDTPEQAQSQAFGLADLGLGERELGYISLPEILSCGAELDLYWEPKTVGQLEPRKRTPYQEEPTPDHHP